MINEWIDLGTAFALNCCLGSYGQDPSYDACIMQQDMSPALQYHKRVLKLM